VVVVHAAPAGHERTVVVGIDGSEESRAALAVGLEEAARLDTDVAALATFEMVDHWVDLSSVVVPSDQEVQLLVQRDAEGVLADALAEHRARHDGQAPAARVVVAEGPAADLLLHRAADAALLVVGSRGHGEFRGLLVGSIALACAMHGAGPVMVVHPQPAHAAAPVARPATAGS
jgi:nucleotide-binding universal stress UspA family protein